MPYKSNAQRTFFHSPAGRKAGIKPSTVQEFDQSTGGSPIPQRSAPHSTPQGIKSRLRKPKVKGF